MNNNTSVSKVTGSHLARNAYLYVRQSSLRQVLTNTESTARQYALRQKAIALGWPASQVITIDTDQGQSGASAADREGFQRLVAEVSMGRAGIVLGLEVSRLARNNADWHRLLEICAMSGALICDEDGLYDPADFNDQLVLGLKGTMSAAELHFIRSRLRGGQLSKARRGELRMGLPVGLVYDPAGNIVLDPDAQVQNAIRHLFAVFARTGSARAVVQTFNTERLLFPIRIRKGAHKGELAWTPMKHWIVLRVLHNPRYAGAFVYGREQYRVGADGKKTYGKVPPEQWTAFFPDSHPGYVSWQQYETNQKVLLGNATAHGKDRAAGPAREGPALLQGLAICGKCGTRMTVAYHKRRNDAEVPDYRCMRKCIQDGAPRCANIPGAGLDTAIGQMLLQEVTPLALEVALQVQAELDNRAGQSDALRRQQLQRAQQRVDLARRRYLAVDPDNRLVADTLEADWNDALRARQTAQDEYDKASTAVTALLTDEHKARIRALATDFPALWANPDTPQRERKRMVRLLVEDVTLTKTDQIHAHIRLRGGQTRSLTLPIPGKAWQIRQTKPETLAALDQLLNDHTDGEAAQLLNTAGHRSGTGKAFTSGIVLDLRRSNRLPSRYERLRAKGLLTINELARHLHVHASTIKAWHRAGLLVSHKATDKNERLFEIPAKADPRLIARQGSPLRNRSSISTTHRGAV